ncbi:MAG: tetratricopeptide repeat protein, partial [Bacteroidia bacterium]
MKKPILILMFSIMSSILFGQNKAEAENLVKEGITYHDKGDYAGAISKYDKALELDKDNQFALIEKALSLLSLEKYEEAISCCQRVIELYPEANGSGMAYVTCGNAYDAINKTDKAIEVYDEGIRAFPGFYLLFFNKGISLARLQEFDEAFLCFQKSVTLNPEHAGSHNAIAHISYVQNKRIPALLSYCRFFTIEPQSNRAVENLSRLRTIMKGNVEETGKKSIQINISPDMLGDTTESGKPNENSFTTTDLSLAISAAMDFDKKYKKKTEIEHFIRKFEIVCSSLKETRKDNYGFFWDYYVPYFIELKDKDFIETLAYIVFASDDNPDTVKWLKGHQNEIDEFFEWTDSYEWKSN